MPEPHERDLCRRSWPFSSQKPSVKDFAVLFNLVTSPEFLVVKAPREERFLGILDQFSSAGTDLNVVYFYGMSGITSVRNELYMIHVHSSACSNLIQIQIV